MGRRKGYVYIIISYIMHLQEVGYGVVFSAAWVSFGFCGAFVLAEVVG